MRPTPKDKWYIMVLGYIVVLFVTSASAGVILGIYSGCAAGVSYIKRRLSSKPARPSAVENPVEKQACHLFARWGETTGANRNEASLYDILGIQWPCGSGGDNYDALEGQARDAYMQATESFPPYLLVSNARYVEHVNGSRLCG
jgi:hypothetical protein